MTTISDTGEVLYLPVGQVHADPQNPRSDLGDLTELKASLVAQGPIEPIVVRPHPEVDGEWMIVAGHRRHAALTELDATTVPAIVRAIGDDEALAVQLVENLHRADLHPVDEAKAYRRLLDLGWRQKDIAGRTGRSQAVVSKRLRLLDLPEPATQAVRSGTLTLDTAYELEKALRTDGIDRDGLLHHTTQLLTADDVDPAAVDEAVRRTATEKAALAEREAVAEKVAADAEAAGHKPLAGEGGARRVGSFYGGVDVDWDDHQTEPCARFTVVQRWRQSKPHFDLDWWCVDFTRHLPEGDSPVKVSTEWLEAYEARTHGDDTPASKAEREAQAAKEARYEFYTATVSAALRNPDDPPVSPGLVYQQAAQLLFDMLTGAELEEILTLLHVDHKRSATVATKLELLRETFRDDPVAATLATVFIRGEGWRLINEPKEHRGQFLRLAGYTGPVASDDSQRSLEGVA